MVSFQILDDCFMVLFDAQLAFGSLSQKFQYRQCLVHFSYFDIYFNKLQIIYMSDLIEDVEQITKIPQNFKYQIKTVLKNVYNGCTSIIKSNNNELIFTFESLYHLLLPTYWKIQQKPNKFKIDIMFVNQSSHTFHFVNSERMKVQLSLLFAKINEKTVPHYRFIVEPDSGIVRFLFMMEWVEYGEIFKKSSAAQQLIGLIISQIKKYIQQINYFFCLGYNKLPNQQQIKSQEQVLLSVNRFKYLLLRSIPNRRQNLQNLTRIKQQNQYNPYTDIAITLYLNDINIINSTSQAISKLRQLEEDDFQLQINSILKNQGGNCTRNSKNQGSQKKLIVNGLIDLVPIGAQTLLSSKGAHSRIYLQNFSYILTDTINLQIYESMQKKDPSQNKTIKSCLAYKIPNFEMETSKNSFLNQLAVLQYLRNQSSPFIGKYFLKVRKNIQQSDCLYMSVYKQSLESFLNKATAFSVFQRLTISYRISKGLCFLSFYSISHRDLKPQNIVLDDKINPKIIDFGSAVPHYDFSKLNVKDNRLLSTPGFSIKYDHLSENIKKRYNKKQYEEHRLFDIYSLGKTICFIFFNSLDLPSPEELCNYGPSLLIQNIYFLVNICLHEDPNQRPTYGEVTSFIGCLANLRQLQYGNRSQK